MIHFYFEVTKNFRNFSEEEICLGKCTKGVPQQREDPGVQAPNASLGTLLSDGQKAFRFLPYQMWAPAIILSIIMIATNLLGDGLRDAFDPQSSDH